MVLNQSEKQDMAWSMTLWFFSIFIVGQQSTQKIQCNPCLMLLFWRHTRRFIKSTQWHVNERVLIQKTSINEKKKWFHCSICHRWTKMQTKKIMIYEAIAREKLNFIYIMSRLRNNQNHCWHSNEISNFTFCMHFLQINNFIRHFQKRNESTPNKYNVFFSLVIL